MNLKIISLLTENKQRNDEDQEEDNQEVTYLYLYRIKYINLLDALRHNVQCKSEDLQKLWIQDLIFYAFFKDIVYWKMTISRYNLLFA